MNDRMNVCFPDGTVDFPPWFSHNANFFFPFTFTVIAPEVRNGIIFECIGRAEMFKEEIEAEGSAEVEVGDPVKAKEHFVKAQIVAEVIEKLRKMV